MHAELDPHPVVVALERPERVDVLRTEHVDEELVRLLEVGHREAEVVGAAHSGQWHGRVLAFAVEPASSRRSSYWIQYGSQRAGRATVHAPESLRLDAIRPMLAARDALCAPRAPSTEKEGVMPSRESLAPGAPWIALRSTEQDWKAADPALLATMLAELHLIRAFEETVLDLAGAGLVHGPAHSSIGQEGGAVGSIVGLRSTDAVNGSHRGHHQFLAKALTHVTGGRFALDALVTPAVQGVLQRTLAEILGLAQGYCRGRGGSMHLQWLEAGALGTNAIVGGGVPGCRGQRLGAAALGHADVTLQLLRRRRRATSARCSRR